MGTSFTELRLFFHIFHYQHTSSIFVWDSLCWFHKPLCWSVRALHAFCVSPCYHLQKGVLRMHPSGSDGSWAFLDWDCRKDKGSRLLWVKSWPASSVMLKESCLWNSWIEVPQSVLERYLQILQKLRQRIWRFRPNRKVNQVLILPTVLI